MKKILLFIFSTLTIFSYSNDFKVMSFNIFGGRKASAYTFFESIKKYNPDFISIQEIDKNTKRSDYKDYTKEIADNLGYKYYFFRKSRDYDEGEYGISIISRYPIEIIYVRTLPSIGIEKRQVIMAKLKDKDILVVNTHLSYDEKENEKQINDLIRTINSVDSKFKIICGDLNILPNSKEYEKLTKDLIDTYSNINEKRIDYIFTNNKEVKIKKAEFLEKEKDLSDHLPYQVNFEI